MDKKKYSIFCTGVMIFFLLCGLITILQGNHTFSSVENRVLQRFPVLHLSARTKNDFLKGNLQSEQTQAMNDQFILRKWWMQNATRLQKKIGEKDINGVYLGKNHYYFAKVMKKDISQGQYFQNLRFLQLLKKKYENIHMTTLLVPSPGVVLSRYLPSHAVLYPASQMYQEEKDYLHNCSVLDLRHAMKMASMNQQVYFRTDHHWTIRGAYVGYQACCQAMGMKPDAFSSFGVSERSDQFYGTMYSKILDPEAVPDELSAPSVLPLTDIWKDGKREQGIYESDFLGKKDKYSFFLGGNAGCEVFKTNQKGKKLLIIKDSFANSLLPFLLRHFSQIDMIDLRYYHGSLSELVEKYKPEELLVLYEMSNFATDKNLKKMIQ